MSWMSVKKEAWESKWVDYYKLLEIDFGVDDKKLKSAYISLIKEYHPDKHPEFESYYKQKTQAFNEAYSILSNSDKRKRYDEEYKKRNKEAINRSSDTTSSNHNESSDRNTDENYNNYSQEEMEAARKAAVVASFIKEKQNAEQNSQKVNDAIDNLLLKAYTGVYNEELYKKSYIILIKLLTVRINKFKVLYEEAQKLLMQNEITELEKIIADMQTQINSVPKNVNDAKQYVEKQLKIEEIRKFCVEEQKYIELLKSEFNNLLIMVLSGRITNSSEYQLVLEKLLAKLQTHIKKIKKYKSEALKYNEFAAIQYFQQYILIIDSLMISCYSFDEIKNILIPLNVITNCINNINSKIKSTTVPNEKLELYHIKIDLISEKAKLEYIIGNRKNIDTETEKEIVYLLAELAYYEKRLTIIEEEINRLRSTSCRTTEEKEKKDDYITEKLSINKMILNIQKKYAKLLGKKAKEENLRNKPMTATLEEQNLNEKRAELEGIEAEIKELNEKIYTNDIEYYNQRVLNLTSDKIDLISEKAKLEYIIGNRKNIDTETEKEIVYLLAELAYYEKRLTIIEEEINRLRSTSCRTNEEKQKKDDYITEKLSINKMIEFKKNHIEYIKNYFNQKVDYQRMKDFEQNGWSRIFY